MKKYLMTMVVMALFAIGFTASDEDTSSNNESSNSSAQIEQQQETTQQPKKNPIEKFVGTYTLYDDWNSGGQMMVADDGRFFYKEYDGSGVKCGIISVISDNAFSVILSHDLYVFNGGDLYSYKKGEAYSHGKSKMGPLKEIVFDLSEKKMFIDKNEYDNQDYSIPEYYKFKFTK